MLRTPVLLVLALLLAAPLALHQGGAVSGPGDGPVTPFLLRNAAFNVTANGTYQARHDVTGVSCVLDATITVGPEALRDHTFNATVTFGPLCAPSLEIRDLVSYPQSLSTDYTAYRGCLDHTWVTLVGTNSVEQCIDWQWRGATIEGQRLGPSAWGLEYTSAFVTDPLWRKTQQDREFWWDRGCTYYSDQSPCHDVVGFAESVQTINDHERPQASVCPPRNPYYPEYGHVCTLLVQARPAGHRNGPGASVCWSYAYVPANSRQLCQAAYWTWPSTDV